MQRVLLLALVLCLPYALTACFTKPENVVFSGRICTEDGEDLPGQAWVRVYIHHNNDPHLKDGAVPLGPWIDPDYVTMCMADPNGYYELDFVWQADRYRFVAGCVCYSHKQVLEKEDWPENNEMDIVMRRTCN